MTAVNKSKQESDSKKTVVFLGSPLIDFTVKIDDDFLNHHGLKPDSAYSITERKDPKMEIFNTIDNMSPYVSIGGSITNTARIFQKLNRSDQVVYFGTTGADDNGDFIKEKLVEEGIYANLFVNNEKNTGKVAVLLNGASRTLVTDLGASRYFPVDTRGVSDIIAKCSHLYFSAFFLSVSYEILLNVFQMTKKPVIIMNLGAPFLSTKYPEQMSKIYENANIIIGNETEHRAFASAKLVSPKSGLKEIIKESIEKFHNNCDDNKLVVIVTRNKNPVLIFTKIKKLVEILEIKVPTIKENKIKDTNGAGDAFVGAFLSNFVQGEPLEKCVNYGIAIAGKVVQCIGCNFD